MLQQPVATISKRFSCKREQIYLYLSVIICLLVCCFVFLIRKKIFSHYEQSRTKWKFRVITPQSYIWILNHF